MKRYINNTHKQQSLPVLASTRSSMKTNQNMNWVSIPAGRPIAIILAGIFISSSLLTHVQAAAGDLDPTFGSGGKVTTDFANGTDSGQAVAIQSDGKIVVAGAGGGSTAEASFALARYNTDGSLDITFGAGGMVTTNFSSGSRALAFAVAMQTNGMIVAAGVTIGVRGDADFALARYNTDGSLDTMFGAGGKVSTAFTPNWDEARAIVIQRDGKIVAAGTTVNSSTLRDFALARYNVDGSLDTTFGSAGKVVTDIAGFDDAVGLALQSDGKIVVAGSTVADFALVRHNSDGSLDTTFGSGGKVTTDIAGNNEGAYDVVIQTNGKIVAGGSSLVAPGNFDFALTRYNTDGTLDSTFGSGGEVVTDFPGSNDQISALALQSDGKIVAAGSYLSSSGFDFALTRYNTDGSLDSSFGAGGKVTTDFGNSDTAVDVALQSDGLIVSVGSTNSSNGTDFALARYFAAPTPCTINCPANISVSNAPNQCGANVTYSNSTTTGDCLAVSCNPPSNSFFPIGTTTVNCTAGGGPDCSFTITVVDTQAPTITCPANVTLAAPAACPPRAGVTATYPSPVASDNCPGVTTSCSPPSGSNFPAGTTTVTCTARDASGMTANCTFVVTVFDVCLQDDSTPQSVLLFNSRTGDYRFCGGTTFTGRGSVVVQGCVVTLTHNAPDRRVSGRVDQSVFRGTASLQSPPGTNRCTISDRNTRDNSCTCGN